MTEDWAQLQQVAEFDPTFLNLETELRRQRQSARLGQHMDSAKLTGSEAPVASGQTGNETLPATTPGQESIILLSFSTAVAPCGGEP